MRIIRPIARIGLFFLGVILLSGQGFCASSQGESGNHFCLSIQTYDDDKRVDGPSVILLLSNGKRWHVMQENGRFCLSDEIVKEESFDLIFEIGRDRFILNSVAVGRFTGKWDFYYGGKHFAYMHGLPKKMHPAKSCDVEYNDGEPGTGDMISGCRLQGRAGIPPI
jgi:hypothetical protein